MYITEASDHLIGPECVMAIPALLRQIALDWEEGALITNLLPALLRSTLHIEGADDVFVCLIPKSRIQACERSRELLSTLSMREHQILELAMLGKSAKNIASEFSISQRTVENHIGAIFKKTLTHRMPELLRLVYSRIY